MRLLRTVLIGALAAFCLAAFAGPAAAQQFTLKYGHVGPVGEDSDDHVSGLLLKDFLESRSQGRIKVEIYPASQLGNFRELVEGVQLNTVELVHTSTGGINQFLPQIQVLDIPYYFRSDVVAEEVSDGPFFDELRAAILKKTGNVRMMSMTNTGRFRSFYTSKKPMRSAADLKGVKMRVINSPLAIEMVKYLGGNATPVAWGELYTALQTGVVEGTKNAASDVVSNNMHEVLKYVVLDEHAYLFGFYFMSESWYKSLPPDLQLLVASGVKQMGNFQREFNKHLERVNIEKFQKSGGTVYVPTSAERATFQKSGPYIKEWFVKNIPDGKTWVDSLDRAVEAAEKQEDSLR